MGRTYAGVLGSVAFLTVLARSLIEGGGAFAREPLRQRSRTAPYEARICQERADLIDGFGPN